MNIIVIIIWMMIGGKDATNLDEKERGGVERET